MQRKSRMRAPGFVTMAAVFVGLPGVFLTIGALLSGAVTNGTLMPILSGNNVKELSAGLLLLITIKGLFDGARWAQLAVTALGVLGLPMAAGFLLEILGMNWQFKSLANLYFPMMNVLTVDMVGSLLWTVPAVPFLYLGKSRKFFAGTLSEEDTALIKFLTTRQIGLRWDGYLEQANSEVEPDVLEFVKATNRQWKGKIEKAAKRNKSDPREFEQRLGGKRIEEAESGTLVKLSPDSGWRNKL